VAVDVEFHSFELSPGTPAEFPGTHHEFLAGHAGVSLDQAAAMGERVTALAAAVGLNYDYDRLQTTNTVLAHQLVHYAKARGRQAEMKERLMKAYFEEGRHVGRIAELADLAAEIGFDRDDVERSLTAGEYLADVRADVAHAGELGIRAVPFFVIEGKYGISGAQESATFANALRRVAEERENALTRVSD